MLDQLGDRSEAVKELRSDHSLDLFVGVFGDDRNTVFLIPSNVLLAMANLGVEVVFDVYA